MKQKWNMDALDLTALLSGLVFFAPVSLLVRTAAGVTLRQFFVLQAVVSLTTLLAELPCGHLTDCIGYQKTLALSQLVLLLARVSLLAAHESGSLALFALEAVLEGIAFSFSSGTQSAYIYTVFPKDRYAEKTAHTANFGTIGFLASTLAYAGLYAALGFRGLLLATAAANALALLAALRIPPELRIREKTAPVRPLGQSLRALLRGRGIAALLVVLGLLSLARLLVNFFYAEKLLQCGVPETWMTAVILGYSAVELLAEPVLRHTPRARQGGLMALFFVLSGAALCLLGGVKRTVPVLLTMLVLPFLLDVPDYLLGARQNALIDAADAGENRAELLSVFSMGLNAAEVFFLLGSSVIADAGAALCFTALGALLAAAGALLLFAKHRKKTYPCTGTDKG